LGSQCTNYLQQHKLVMTCVAWGADRKDAVLHRIILFLACRSVRKNVRIAKEKLSAKKEDLFLNQKKR
jgi:hypothetical protein